MNRPARRRVRKPILCLDFDGVLHSYKSGWRGADNIPDPPVDGAMCFLRDAVKELDVQIYSSRSSQVGGIKAMKEWLWKYLHKELDEGEILRTFGAITWPTSKPPAMVTLDDRALTFKGVFPDLVTLRNFKPWNQK